MCEHSDAVVTAGAAANGEASTSTAESTELDQRASIYKVKKD